MYKIYVNDRPVLLVESGGVPAIEGLNEPDHYLGLYQGKKKQLFQYLDLLDKNPDAKQVVLFSPNLESLWEDFQSCFKILEAAGGLVENEAGETLVFFRRGFWDLPKGKIDPGETPEEAAVREVQEETGIQNIDLGPLITTTWHTYRMKDKRILKKTYWYKMDTSDTELVPQTEEDIEEIKWVKLEEWLKSEPKMYRSLLEVVVFGDEELKG